jgi:hypothetical protein
MKKLILMSGLFLMIGCDDHVNNIPTKTNTNVNVESYLMSAEDLDLAAIITKVKAGDLKNPQDLEQFINLTPGINNIDLDQDQKIDEISVKEEHVDGSIAFAIIAHPLSKPEVSVAEISVTRNVTGGNVVISGSYPSYVHGYHEHYYNHTLTGSVVGDMMFYHYIFNPHTVYVHSYTPHYYQLPRVVVSRTSLVSVRTSSYKTYNLSPSVKTTIPNAYKPVTTFTKRSLDSVRSTPFYNRGNGYKPAPNSFKPNSFTPPPRNSYTPKSS